ACCLFAQPDTEVYLLDIVPTSDGFGFENLKNISNNPGYDNQPSFYESDFIFFSSTRNGQTDIAKYDHNSGSISWVSDTPKGSEYSPLKIPGIKAVSAIRLDEDGTQLLYSYKLSDGKSEVLLEDLKVGYHVWASRNQILAAVLTEDRMDLVASNLKDGSNYTYQKNIGRSLHNIPGMDRISFISYENSHPELKSIDPLSGATDVVVRIPQGVQDICWLKNGSILAGNGNRLLLYNPSKAEDWETVKIFENKDLYRISRLAVNDEGTKLALVAEGSPEFIVQKQLDAYNSRDIEAFAATYSDDVKLFSFPNTLRAEGVEKLKEQYGGFFAATPDLKAEIVNRIVIGQKVIDEELVTVNGQQFSAVAIYEVENGKIAKVTFIQ
ncbi:MAG: nuclear transport factor 2 family protein, partial [Bacteroidota bacterium]